MVIRGLIGAVAGALVFFGIGQAFAAAGGGCILLCKPEMAGIYGGLMGIVVAFTFDREA